VSLTQGNPDNYRSYLGSTNDSGGTTQLILDIDGYFADLSRWPRSNPVTPWTWRRIGTRS